MTTQFSISTVINNEYPGKETSSSSFYIQPICKIWKDFKEIKVNWSVFSTLNKTDGKYHRKWFFFLHLNLWYRADLLHWQIVRFPHSELLLFGSRLFRCRSRGEFEESIVHRGWSTQTRYPPWLFTPGQTSRSPKKGYQWPHKKESCPPKIKKKSYCFRVRFRSFGLDQVSI